MGSLKDMLQSSRKADPVFSYYHQKVAGMGAPTLPATGATPVPTLPVAPTQFLGGFSGGIPTLPYMPPGITAQSFPATSPGFPTQSLLGAVPLTAPTYSRFSGLSSTPAQYPAPMPTPAALPTSTVVAPMPAYSNWGAPSFAAPRYHTPTYSTPAAFGGSSALRPSMGYSSASFPTPIPYTSIPSTSYSGASFPTPVLSAGIPSTRVPWTTTPPVSAPPMRASASLSRLRPSTYYPASAAAPSSYSSPYGRYGYSAAMPATFGAVPHSTPYPAAMTYTSAPPMRPW